MGETRIGINVTIDHTTCRSLKNRHTLWWCLVTAFLRWLVYSAVLFDSFFFLDNFSHLLFLGKLTPLGISVLHDECLSIPPIKCDRLGLPDPTAEGGSCLVRNHGNSFTIMQFFLQLPNSTLFLICLKSWALCNWNFVSWSFVLVQILHGQLLQLCGSLGPFWL